MIKNVFVWTSLVCSSLISFVACSNDSTAGTQVGNEFTLSGVAATGYALSESEVRFESKNKVLATTYTDSLGRFNIDVSESVLKLNKVYYLKTDSTVGAPFFLELDNQNDTIFVLMHPVGDYLASLTDSMSEFKSRADFKAWQDSVLSRLLGPGVKSEEVFHNRNFVAAKEMSQEKFSPWDLMIHTVSDSARRAQLPPHILMDEISKNPSYLLSDSTWRNLLASQAGYLGMTEVELLSNLELWLDQDKSLYDLKNEIGDPHQRGYKDAVKDGYEGKNRFLFEGLLKSIETQHSFSDKPKIEENKLSLEQSILGVWDLNKRNLGEPIKNEKTLFYMDFIDDLQSYIANAYVTSFEIEMWQKPEFAEVFKELWDRNVNPLLKAGSFKDLPVGNEPNSTSTYWTTEEDTLKEGFKNMDRSVIQSWINQIVAEYPVNPFGDSWSPKARLDL